jgi:hypothetical protein
MTSVASLEQARGVADAVLYEGYLLYPYRATSTKNQARWQFGVLGPPGAAEAGVGEESSMAADFLLMAHPDAQLTIHVRFLQLQARVIEALDGHRYRAVDELSVGDARWFTWDEAVECEHTVGPVHLSPRPSATPFLITVAGAREIEQLIGSEGQPAGRLVRTRAPLVAVLDLDATVVDGLLRVAVRLTNAAPSQADKTSATAVSLIGAHLLIETDDADFVSLVDPPPEAAEAASTCTQHRWWPVLAGPPEETRVLLVSPIIVEDHARLAPESPGSLFDSTEIDEILTLRVMTMTEQEKAEARATDRRAAEIIDRCDAMTADEQERLHGVLREPRTVPEVDWPVLSSDVPWWDPEADASVSPDTDSVQIGGVLVSKGSLVTVRPTRRADAQDIFFEGMVARVAAVLSDVDGATHVAVTLVDDPAADLHDWYGRYLYFAPDELSPAEAAAPDAVHELTRKGEPL